MGTWCGRGQVRCVWAETWELANGEEILLVSFEGGVCPEAGQQAGSSGVAQKWGAQVCSGA